MKNIFLIFFLVCFVLSVKAVASDQSDEVNEYKAPSGGWKIIHRWNVEEKTYENHTLQAVSPTGKETMIDKWLNLVSVTWLNNHTAEIIETCGTPCKIMCFFDTERGASEPFFDVIAYSINDNLIAYPSYNKKKDRHEITISEIYTNKKQPIAVVYRKWYKNPLNIFIENSDINNRKFSARYRDAISDEDVLFEKEPPFVVCDDNSSKEEGSKIEYCSIAEDDYKKGYIWFAAEQPPVGMIDTPKESPLCYRFPSFGLDDQLKKLKEKYGAALYDEKITKEDDGSGSLSAKRKDETGKEIVYFYFDNPMSCAEYQTKRLGEAPPVPYYDYGGCVGECCGYHMWTAKEKVALRKDHSDLSPVVTIIEANEKVDALTGIVITTQPGKIKVLKNISTNKNIDCGVPFEKGDNIYTLHYSGEGYSLIWHNGQLYDCTVIFEEEEHLRDIGKEKSEWWAKISTKNGKTGWTREIEKFSDVYCTE